MNQHNQKIERQLAEMLRAERAASFSPFFADRVMKRLSPADTTDEPEPSLYDALRWAFVRVAFVGIVLVVAIGALNAIQFGSGDVGTLVDALLGLPSDSIADMLTYDLI